MTQFVSSSSQFSSQTLSVGPTWAYPITEFQYLRFGFSFDSSQLLTNSLSSAMQAQEWVQQNGHPYSRIAHDDATNNTTSSTARTSRTWRRWSAGTGIRATAPCLPTAAFASPISAAITVPIDNVQYYIANYQFVKYVPLWKRWTLSFLEGVDYGAPLRRHHRPAAVSPVLRRRSRQRARLSREPPRAEATSSAIPTAAICASRARTSCIFPMPAKWAQTARVSVFFDMGGVYETGASIKFYGPGQRHAGELPPLELLGHRALGRCRRAVARAPGSVPVQLRRAAERPVQQRQTTWGDETEGFQFSVGKAF